jgi:hypothetical protein
MVYLVAKAIQSYLSYPTQTDVNSEFQWPQNFPAFTFCNIGKFRFDQFIGPFINFTSKYNIPYANDTKSFSKQHSQYIPDFIKHRLQQNQSLDAFFFPLASILYKCTYNKENCTAADFISFTVGSYGLCHTFNAKLKDGTDRGIRSVNENGGDGNLELGLYVYRNQYVPHVADSK